MRKALLCRLRRSLSGRSQCQRGRRRRRAKPPKPPKPPKLTTVKLLAFNDFHGHLEAGTPGTIARTPRPASLGAGRRGGLPRRTHEGAAGHQPEHHHVSARAT